MTTSKICLNTHKILNDADIVADNVELAMHADVDAENAKSAESKFTFSATISTTIFNICNIIYKFKKM